MRNPLRYLALGDSYTIGESLSVENSWPMQWAQALRVRGLAIQDPGIIAKTGWATDELAAALDEADAQRTLSLPYDLVSLSIGVNNQYRERSLANYREEFSHLLQRAIAYAGGHHSKVVVVSIPDWGITEFARASGRDIKKIADELDAFNQAKTEISQQAGVHWADISQVTRELGSELQWYADDGLHPSPLLYTRWVNELLKIHL